MAFRVNTPVSVIEILRDDDDVAISGLLDGSVYWTTKEAYEAATPATTATLTATSVGNGEYRFAFTPTTPTSGGPIVWAYHVIYDDGTTFREFVGNVEVAPYATVDSTSYTTIGDVDTVKQMLRATEDTTFGDDVDDRLTALQALVSEQLQWRLGRTFGTPASDTTIVVFAGAHPTLWLPRPARAITSVTAWGDMAAGTFSNGTLLTASDYVYDPKDYATGLIYGLRLIGVFPWTAGSWGSDDGNGFGITPVQIVGDFSDSDDDAYVPADVNYAANFLIMALYRREQGIPFAAVTANGMEIPLDPWKDPVVQLVLERYGVGGRDTRLLVW